MRKKIFQKIFEINILELYSYTELNQWKKKGAKQKFSEMRKNFEIDTVPKIEDFSKLKGKEKEKWKL